MARRDVNCTKCRERIARIWPDRSRPTYAHGFDAEGRRLYWAFNARGEQVRVTIPED